MRKKRKIKAAVKGRFGTAPTHKERAARLGSDGLFDFFADRTNLFLALGLVIGCLVIFGRTMGFDFINIDDSGYIYENTMLGTGLSWDSFKWAFTTFSQANWHPLTWLSYLTEVTLWGSKPGTFHLVNALFHAVNSALLYVVLKQLTGSTWRSATVSGLFAFHPAHVESVAWIAERKDVLSVFFWMCATYFYVRYARLGKSPVSIADRVGRNLRGRFYFLTVLAMALGVLAKPMIVTLPFTLLLLDYWPLERIGKLKVKIIGSLVLEKLPLFALSAVSAVVTILAQRSGGAIVTLENLTFLDRLANALLSYAKYTVVFFYPVNLGLVYEYRREIPAWQIAGAISLLTLTSFYSIWKIREQKYFFTGWFWFLGTLIPVIGLLQVGLQAMADRYTYVPFIGLSIAIVWLTADLIKNLDRRIAFAAACLILLGFAGLTFRQVTFWKNSDSLYRHTLAVTPGSAFIERNLCLDLLGRGKLDEAEEQCQNAVRHKPAYNEPYKLLGLIYLKRQNFGEAVKYCTLAVDRKPEDFGAYANLARVFVVQGKLDEAAKVIDKVPSTATSDQEEGEGLFQAYSLLGLGYAQKNDYEKAAIYFGKALTLNGSDVELKSNLGAMLYKAGKKEEGIRQIEEAIRQNPDKPEPYNILGLILSEQGKREEAIRQFQKALQLKPDFEAARKNLQGVESQR
jgi:tetratricopeptide (TPR) repeat protein